MKRDVTVVQERAESVGRYFGTTGFSAIYGNAKDEERLKAETSVAAQGEEGKTK